MNTLFNNFATTLIDGPKFTTATLQDAKTWYKKFTGTHAVKMDDNEIVEIYQLSLLTNDDYIK